LICAQISPVSNSNKGHKLGLPASSRKKRVEREGVKGTKKRRRKQYGRKGKKEVFCFELMGKLTWGVYNSLGVLLDFCFIKG
jgi:hypothetical protein